MPDHIAQPDAYRDPSGFVFKRNGIYYRHVASDYASNYQLLMRSGLYKALTEAALLVSHEEVHENLTEKNDWHVTLLPQQIHPISYASEWVPEQLKDAALLTLQVNGIALKHGMILKDATPFNTQFLQGRPVLIDSLSFEKYDETKPWVAYRQFCECFLFPLYIHHYLNGATGRIAAAWPEGISSAATAAMLPFRARLNAGAMMHVFLQSSVGRREAARGTAKPAFSRQKLQNILLHLQHIIRSLRTAPVSPSSWSGYYETDIQSEEYIHDKEKTFLQFADSISFTTALDIGANNGRFSLLLARPDRHVVAIDADWQSIHLLYAQLKQRQVNNILPLCVDICNPTPATGFMNTERSPFIGRMRSDLVVALAVVHHLVLADNVPMESLASLMATLAKNALIIEFVPADDEKTKKLIRNKDRHHPYSITLFEQSFSRFFFIEQKKMIAAGGRVLYLMKKRGDEK